MFGYHEFLREVCPILGLEARRFERKGIKRRVERRMAEKGLFGFKEYETKVKEDAEEQKHLTRLLTVTISRFFRDWVVFDRIESVILPDLLEKRKPEELRVWSIGCASGEEPYSLLLLWQERFEAQWPDVRLRLLATDVERKLLERAKEGRYKKSGMKEVREEILKKFFTKEGEFYVLDRKIREKVEFRVHDLLREEPFREMDMVFCRNLAFTYFSREGQRSALRKIFESLRPEGILVIGKEESLPLHYPTLFTPIFSSERIYRKFEESIPNPARI